jgi:hypothetical protein
MGSNKIAATRAGRRGKIGLVYRAGAIYLRRRRSPASAPSAVSPSEAGSGTCVVQPLN